MVLDFYLKYSTQFGQQIFLLSDDFGNAENVENGRIAMHYHNQDYWRVQISLNDNFRKNIRYYYAVVNDDGLEIYDGEKSRYLDLSDKRRHHNYEIIDLWNDAGNIKNTFFSKAFTEVLLPTVSHSRHEMPQKYTHEFRVKAPRLGAHETICLSGSTTHLNNWDKENIILLNAKNNWFYTRISFDENEWPASYKYGIYNLKEKKLVAFEEGENRTLRSWELQNGTVILHDGLMNYQKPLWKGAGINIPVFSLRSNKSFGVGEFSDLKLLTDWAKKTGITLIQLLPINDTSAQNNWRDSYPYAAISSFALHPLYINLEKVAGKSGSTIIKSLRKKQKQLNDLPSVDYEQVMKFKLSVLHELFDLQKDALKEDKKYQMFFTDNQHWLVSYAAFSYLKEKNKTSDFSLWKNHSVYNEAAIQNLASPSRNYHSEIAFYYFVQYHLHLQLQEAVLYAHKQKIVLKGDIPIGIYRYSCDAWVRPALYNMKEQAGAPPDDFASKGQNWGFPTYNWDEMKKDNFGWWRTRFFQLSKYFDVFRIDHILGFFRIWSIPTDSLEGTMGHFDPALPVYKSEFERNGIAFDKKRFCEPFINEEVLSEIFAENALLAKEHFLTDAGDGTYQLKDEVSTQKRALQYLSENDLLSFKDGLFQLISNFILFEAVDGNGESFHFRISINKTSSFRALESGTRQKLMDLYNNYFYHRQDYFWKKQAMQKLPQLKRSTQMLVCGEDLGMVPHSVPDVMKGLGILGLEVERMPKNAHREFLHPGEAPYLSVVTPSTHDMSTLREWWTEDRERTQRFYNSMLGHSGNAPAACEPWVVKDILNQHLNSPAMWAIFLIQDILALHQEFRTEDPKEERINIPADAQYYWRYRMVVPLETLNKSKEFNEQLRELIAQSDRLHE